MVVAELWIFNTLFQYLRVKCRQLIAWWHCIEGFTAWTRERERDCFSQNLYVLN